MQVMYKQGAQISVNPEIAYREIERIRKENNGEVNISQIVTDSSLKDAPLHNEFEWSDKKAGHLYRMQQARYIVRSIEVIHNENPNIRTRAYEIAVKQSSDGDKKSHRAYTSIDEILADPIMRDELLMQAIKDALAFRRRYHALSELSIIFSAMDQALLKFDLTG